jgi:cytoskeleton protein RodZ
MSEKGEIQSTGDPNKEQQQDKIVREELSPGAQLAARRQELNWSVDQVASQLNLAPRQIQALEADNYAALPGMAIVRGFIRAYAKLLRIDAAPLLQAVASEVTSPEAIAPLRRALPNMRFAENRLSAPAGKTSLPSWLVLILLLLILLAGGLFIMHRAGMPVGLPSFLQPGTADAPTPIGQAQPEQQTDVTEVSDVMSSDVGKGVADLASDADAEGSETRRDPPANNVSASDASSGQSAPAVNAAAVRESGAGAGARDMLTLKMLEDSWIEIKRSDNSTVIAALLKAGTTESFKITGPVVMTVGNASGVEATLRGKPLVLKGGSKTNVARLNLK